MGCNAGHLLQVRGPDMRLEGFPMRSSSVLPWPLEDPVYEDQDPFRRLVLFAECRADGSTAKRPEHLNEAGLRDKLEFSTVPVVSEMPGK